MRIIRFFAGLLLLPACFVLTRTAASLVAGLRPGGNSAIPPPAAALAGGFLLWQVIFTILPRPVRIYVLAHELTHALWGALMGARISKLRIAKESGSVTLSKTNFLIILAPYFFPLYTVIVVAAFYILSIFFDVGQHYLVWLGLVGFTWGFHVTFTVATLMQKQSDIRACGHLFSYAVIYLFNVIGVCLWIVLVSSATIEEMAGFLHNYGRDTVCFFREKTADILDNILQ